MKVLIYETMEENEIILRKTLLMSRKENTTS